MRWLIPILLLGPSLWFLACAPDLFEEHGSYQCRTEDGPVVVFDSRHPDTTLIFSRTGPVLLVHDELTDSQALLDPATYTCRLEEES